MMIKRRPLGHLFQNGGILNFSSSSLTMDALVTYFMTICPSDFYIYNAESGHVSLIVAIWEIRTSPLLSTAGFLEMQTLVFNIFLQMIDIAICSQR